MLVVEQEKCLETVASLRLGAGLLEKDGHEAATVWAVVTIALGWIDAEDRRRRAGTLDISRWGWVKQCLILWTS